jgi:hypothetical protein
MAEPISSMMFQTPLIEADLIEAEVMNASLVEAIAKRRSGIALSPATPWSDDADLHSWGPDAAAMLAEQAVALAVRYSMDVGAPEAPRFAWHCSLSALALPSGAALQLEDRPGATWTVYYCIHPGAAGEANGGLLLLQDPRLPTLHRLAPELRFRLAGGVLAGEPLLSFVPAQARMMMVPGWLRAGISRYSGQGEQLWVIVDIFAEPH